MSFGLLTVIYFTAVGGVLVQSNNTVPGPLLYFVAEPPTEVTAFDGGSVSIDCSARAADASHVTIAWLKDGVDALQYGDGRRSVTSSGALVIAPVLAGTRPRSAMRLAGPAAGPVVAGTRRRKPGSASSPSAAAAAAGTGAAGDEGTYECLAKHALGTIISRPSTLRLAALSAEFTVLPSSVTLTTGRSARLRCVGRASPPANISWFKDNEALSPSDRVIMLEAGGGVLKLLSLSPADSGLYHCVARSEFGQRNSSTATVTVVSQSPGQEHTSSQVSCPAEHQTAIVNTSIVVDCFVSSLPMPTITWTKLDDSGYVESTAKLPVSGSGMLSIREVALSDAGLYSCSWTDPLTQNPQSCFTTISVLASPRPSTSLEPETRRRHGQPLHLHCNFTGQPTPVVRWFVNGSDVTDTSQPLLRISSSDDGMSTLSIVRTSVADSGFYQCRAINTLGVYQLQTFLNVQTADITLAPVVNVRAVTLSSSSLHVTWEDAPQSSNVTMVAYAVHYYPSLIKHKEIQRVVQTKVETLVGLKPNTNYSIYITAFANNGRSEPSQTVTATTLPEDLPLATPAPDVMFSADLSGTTEGDDNITDNGTTGGVDFTDQQLGIIIGSCIGLSCITISVLIVFVRARCCLSNQLSVSTAHTHSHMANGSVPSYQTRVCHCHVVLPDGVAAPAVPVIQHVPPIAPVVSGLVPPAPSSHCDTKGGYMSNGLNGKVKCAVDSTAVNGHKLIPSSSQHTDNDNSQLPLLGDAKEQQQHVGGDAGDDLDGIDYSDIEMQPFTAAAVVDNDDNDDDDGGDAAGPASAAASKDTDEAVVDTGPWVLASDANNISLADNAPT